jgi:protein-S-isoprenylcysteine O-methyltransferase Ste14
VLGLLEWIFQASLVVWVVAEAWLQVRQYRQGERARTTEWPSLGVVILAIWLGNVLAKTAMVHLPALRIPVPYPVLLGLGLVLLWTGVGFRLWAIRTLGRYFRGVVHIQEGHQVVRSGPYHYLRHPSYTGALVAVFGIGLTFANVAALVAFVGCVLLGVLYRIRVEERVLLAGLGSEYAEYAAHTRRLVPGVW